MRTIAIALLAPFLLLPAISSASACLAAKLTVAAAATTELSAQTAAKKKPAKAKAEKVEYMKSAAPPEPKKK